MKKEKKTVGKKRHRKVDRVQKIVKHVQQTALLTEADACRFLSVSRSTLYKWRRDDKIAYERIGGTIYYPHLTFLCVKNSLLIQQELDNKP